jgi:hypothetical protein
MSKVSRPLRSDFPEGRDGHSRYVFALQRYAVDADNAIRQLSEALDEQHRNWTGGRHRRGHRYCECEVCALIAEHRGTQ